MLAARLFPSIVSCMFHPEEDTCCSQEPAAVHPIEYFAAEFVVTVLDGYVFVAAARMNIVVVLVEAVT